MNGCLFLDESCNVSPIGFGLLDRGFAGNPGGRRGGGVSTHQQTTRGLSSGGSQEDWLAAGQKNEVSTQALFTLVVRYRDCICVAAIP